MTRFTLNVLEVRRIGKRQKPTELEKAGRVARRAVAIELAILRIKDLERVRVLRAHPLVMHIKMTRRAGISAGERLSDPVTQTRLGLLFAGDFHVIRLEQLHDRLVVYVIRRQALHIRHKLDGSLFRIERPPRYPHESPLIRGGQKVGVSELRRLARRSGVVARDDDVDPSNVLSQTAGGCVGHVGEHDDEINIVSDRVELVLKGSLRIAYTKPARRHRIGERGLGIQNPDHADLYSTPQLENASGRKK